MFWSFGHVFTTSFSFFVLFLWSVLVRTLVMFAIEVDMSLAHYACSGLI